MILDTVKPNIEKSDNFQEKFFSIGDYGMVFDILRSKMYSNPISSICREISCNARDAMREAMKFDVPIQITLPNDLDPNYRVKDTGVGISPDRVENIFIKFGASTKRNDNTQTGAFGIGCKVPFSYSDTFTVETNYNGTHYNYVCYIDETKVGKIALLSKEETSEQNGTEIIIPIKSNDFYAFKESTEFTTRHWEVKPIIKGAKIEYKATKSIISGKEWMIADGDNLGYYSTDNKIKLIIDEIEYPIDTTQLRSFASNTIFDNIDGDMYLYFNTGDISISTNREQIHIDDKTKKKINEKLEIIKDEIRNSILEKINAQPTLFDVYRYMGNELVSSVRNTSFIFPFDYKGLEIKKLNLNMSDYANTRTFALNKLGKPIQHTKFATNLSLDQNTDTYINDLGIDTTPNDVAAAFEGKIKKVQVINPKSGVSYDDMFEKLNFDKMGFKLLSTLPMKEKKDRKSSGLRITVFKFNGSGFSRTNLEDFKADTNKKIMCSLTRDEYNGRRDCYIKTENKNYYANDILYTLTTKNKDISIYGIDNSIPSDKLKKEFVECMPPEKYIEELLKNYSTQDIAKIQSAYYQTTYTENTENIAKIIKLLKDKKSLVVNYFDLLNEMIELKKSRHIVDYYIALNADLSEQVEKFNKDNSEFNIEVIRKKLKKRYPLIELGNIGYYGNTDKDIAHYINLIDADLEKDK